MPNPCQRNLIFERPRGVGYDGRAEWMRIADLFRDLLSFRNHLACLLFCELDIKRILGCLCSACILSQRPRILESHPEEKNREPRNPERLRRIFARSLFESFRFLPLPQRKPSRNRQPSTTLRISSHASTWGRVQIKKSYT